MRLRVATKGVQSSERVVIDVSAANCGPAPVKWDRAFETFLRFGVEADGVRIPLSLEGNAPPLPFKDRFCVLNPGEQYTRELVLTDSLRQLNSGYAYNFGMGDVPFASDVTKKLVLPEGARECSISVTYVVDPISFHALFEQDSQEIGVPLFARPADVKFPLDAAGD